MQFIQTAAYDPIFWLHHSYVDKIWAERQDNQDLQPMTKSELEDIVLRPFEGKLIQLVRDIGTSKIFEFEFSKSFVMIFYNNSVQHILRLQIANSCIKS